MAGTLTATGVRRAAQALGVDAATIRAVTEVEASGEGFLADGRPKVLFESHIFSRLTGSRFNRAYPGLSTAQPDRAGYRLDQYTRLYQALQLDAEAALQSASWGLFQIMGFNWKACGEKSLHGFVLAMHHNEDAHLALFTAFIQERGLTRALQKRDWAEFARIYNGPGYAANAYDTKLAAAYARHAAQGGS